MSADGWHSWIRRLFTRTPRRACPRRLWLERLEDRVVPTTFFVDTGGDNNPTTGGTASATENPLAGDLRYCISAALDLGQGQIDFDLPAGQEIIQLADALPNISGPIVIDGTTQRGYAGQPLVTIRGTGQPFDTSQTPTEFDGLHFTVGVSDLSGSPAVYGLAIDNFYIGVRVDAAAGTTIQGNYIGVAADGVTPDGNIAQGIRLTASSCTISGNVISGNQQTGLWILGNSSGNADSNIISGNKIGTNADGSRFIPNSGNYGGVLVQGASGGSADGNTISGNTISGNDVPGLVLYATNDTGTSGDAGSVTGTMVQGNTFEGNNGYGVVIEGGASSNTIDGTTAHGANVISGNTNGGVLISGSGTDDNVVQGNTITHNLMGVGGPVSPQNGDGVAIAYNASGNVIGGTAAADANVIYGNQAAGVRICFSATNNFVEGNLIGVDSSGAAPGNSHEGVVVNAFANTTTISGNVIGGNPWAGISLPGSNDNIIQGNYIGVSPSGARIANGMGVYICPGSTSADTSNGNLIGGTAAGQGNVISGNTGDGVELVGPYLDQTTIEGNLIGVAPSGDEELGNGGNGISLLAGTHGTTIGSAGAPNIISGNGGAGVLLDGGGTDANKIEDNYIGTDITGVLDLGNAGDGVRFQNGASSNVVGVGPFGGGIANVIAFNAKGVVVVGDLTANNTIRGNSIFANDGPGIDLGDDGPTPNGTPGPGPNDFLNTPLIASVASDGSSAEVRGSLNAAYGNYQIDFYASPANGDPFQGETFLGSTPVATDTTGSATFDATMLAPPPPGWVVDATATDIGEDSTAGDTSEFSPGPPAAFAVTAPLQTDEQNAFGVTVRATDAYGDTTVNFLGTVHLSSDDPRAMLPADYTFTEADAGIHTFHNVRLLTPGPETLTASGAGLQGHAVVVITDTAPTVSLDPVDPAAAGAALQATGHITDPDGSVWAVAVDYGDGMTAQFNTTLKTFSLRHVYSQEGSYLVKVVVTDESGVSSPPDVAHAEVFEAGADPRLVNVCESDNGHTNMAAAPGVTALFTHNGPDPAYLLVTPLPPTTTPALTLFSTGPGGGTDAVSYDVRGVNLGVGDTAVVTFSYPANDAAPQLFYFDRAAGVFRPIPGMVNTANHTITVVFNQNSKPSISDLKGTVFTIAAAPVVLPLTPTVNNLANASVPPSALGSSGASFGGFFAAAVGGFAVGAIGVGGGGGEDDADPSVAAPAGGGGKGAPAAVQEILGDLPGTTPPVGDAGTPPGTAVLSPSQSTTDGPGDKKDSGDPKKKPMNAPDGPGLLWLWLTAPPLSGRPDAPVVAASAPGAVQRSVAPAASPLAVDLALAAGLPFAAVGLLSRKGGNKRVVLGQPGARPRV